MRKIGSIFATCGLLVCLLAGCGSAKADQSSLQVKKNGNIVSRSVEEFNTEVYSTDELKQYVNDIIAEYTGANGEDTVKLNSLSVKNGVAVMVITYEDYKDYNEFNGSNLFVGTIGEAKEAGYKFEGNFVAISGKYAMLCGADEFESKDASYVVIADEAVNMELPTDILYSSRDDMVSVNGKKASLKKGADILFPEKEEEQSPETETEYKELEIIYTSSDESSQPSSSAKEVYSFDQDRNEDAVCVYMICK